MRAASGPGGKAWARKARVVSAGAVLSGAQAPNLTASGSYRRSEPGFSASSRGTMPALSNELFPWPDLPNSTTVFSSAISAYRSRMSASRPKKRSCSSVLNGLIPGNLRFVFIGYRRICSRFRAVEISGSGTFPKTAPWSGRTCSARVSVR